MQKEIRICGRVITPEQLELIRDLLATEGHRGRTHLSQRLCQLWDWRQRNGDYREIACREMLRKLQHRGLIALPLPLRATRKPGYRNRTSLPSTLETTPVQSAIHDFPDLTIALVSRTVDEKFYNGLIGAYHYLGYGQGTGEQLKYVIFLQARPLAAIGFSAGVWRVAITSAVGMIRRGEKICRSSSTIIAFLFCPGSTSPTSPRGFWLASHAAFAKIGKPFMPMMLCWPRLLSRKSAFPATAGLSRRQLGLCWRDGWPRPQRSREHPVSGIADQTSLSLSPRSEFSSTLSNDMSMVSENRRFTLKRPSCPQCVKLQEEIKSRFGGTRTERSSPSPNPLSTTENR